MFEDDTIPMPPFSQEDAAKVGPDRPVVTTAFYQSRWQRAAAWMREEVEVTPGIIFKYMLGCLLAGAASAYVVLRLF